MATRINAYHREQITQRLLKHAFEKRERAAKKGWKDLGDAVYKDLYPASVRRHIQALGEDFFEKDTDVRVNFGGVTTSLFFYKQDGSYENRPISKAHDYAVAEVYAADHPLAERYFALKDDEGKLSEERQVACAQIDSLLRSAPTLEKLFELWPEVRKHAEDFLADYREKTNLPAIPIQDLNRQLNLTK